MGDAPHAPPDAPPRYDIETFATWAQLLSRIYPVGTYTVGLLALGFAVGWWARGYEVEVLREVIEWIRTGATR